MKARIYSRTLGGKLKAHDVDNFVRVEFFVDHSPQMVPGVMLFQVSPDADTGRVPSLRVRAVEGVHVGGVYFGGALDVRPEVANVVSLVLRRES